MHPRSATMRLLLTATLLAPGALVLGTSAACSQGSAKAAASSDTVASNDSPADKADMKKVILNVFGMT